ncbi:MAG: hypothetical protein GY913_07135 [Proteobacteria bacterium]|nr:hypothetical protein [Pseudomonadota bacterium]MCP4916682.1 hypothetical protein [Pseudomonadota bacterium]
MLSIILALSCTGEDEKSRPNTPKGKKNAGAPLVERAAGPADGILPIGPDDLVPPDMDFGDGLAALMVGPIGQQDKPVQAVVVFDRPMVPLTGLDDTNVALSCDVDGVARWAGTSTAVFSPNGGRFPRSSQITCTAPQGTAGTDGTALVSDLSWTFQTDPPAIRRTVPSAGATQVDPEQPILIVFDQPVDPGAVRVRMSMTGSDGSSPKLKVERPDPEWEGGRVPKEIERAVLVSADMVPNVEYELTVAAGLNGLEGPVGTTDAVSFSFETYPPAAVEDYQPIGAAVDPYSSIRIELATVTDAEEIANRITIDPPPPDGFDPARAYSWRTWSYGTRLAPMTTYKVKVKGGWKDTHGQVIKDGLEWEFTTGHLSPLVDNATGFRLYPSNNPTELPTRSRNVSEVFVGVKPLTQVQALAALEQNDFFRSDHRETTETITVVSDRESDDTIHVDTVDLAEHLDDGHGLVVVETWSPEIARRDGTPYYERALLVVTDLGVTLKSGPGGVTTWVTRLSDGTPVPRANVTLYKDGRVAWTGATNDEGLATSTDIVESGWRYWNDPILAVVELDGDMSITSTDSPHDLYLWDYGLSHTGGADEEAEIRTFSFSDRGVYKPGDVAHIVATARLADADGLHIPETNASWACTDARGNEIQSGETEVSGRLSFDVELPEDMALGSAGCSIEFDAGDDLYGSTWAAIPVHAYRAPTFRVDVEAEAEAYVGETLSAIGEGRYLFGAAMSGASATWTVRAQDTTPRPEGWDEFRFAGDESSGWWEREAAYQETIAQGEGQLDADGAIPIEAVLESENGATRTLEIEVQVTDTSRQRLANRSHVTLHPASFYLGLRPTAGIGRAGDKMTWDLIATTPEGRASTRVPVDIQIARRTWDVVRKKGMDGRWTWESTSTDEPVHSATVATTAGPVAVPFTPSEAGYYVLTATAKDDSGRLAKSQDGLYVAGAGASWARSDDNTVELVPDKRSYAAGDVASILVKAPKDGMSALVTVERERVLERRVVQLKGAADAIEIEIGESHAPNVFVSVMLTEGAPPAESPDAGMPSWHLGYVELDVSAEGRRLDVAIATDAKVYQPGEDVTITLKALKGENAAAGADVVLYAVDHGVLSLTAYTTPQPFDSFWRDHSLNVLTADNRTRVVDRAALLAKGAPAGGGGGDGGPALRSRFETTPLWRSDLKTDAEGEVEVTFTLPDDLTTFRIMAVAEHGDESFGSGEHEIRVTRPLIASPALPRVLRPGDRASAGIVVHNNRDEEREFAIVAEAWGVDLADGLRSVTVPAQSALEVPFELTNPVPGEATFHFDVEAGEDRDKVEIKIPVILPVPVETVATAGTSTEALSEELEIPSNAQPGVGGLAVRVSPSVLVGTDSSLDYLVDYPHGCLEQTSSKLLAVVLAKELGEKAGIQRSGVELDAIAAAGVARMELFHHPSGGFTYWPGSTEPSALPTAHAAEVLHHAAELGVGPGVSEETVRFLRQFMDGRWTPTWWGESTRESARARVALTLARIGEGDPGYNEALYERRAKLSLTGTAELMETIARTGGPDDRTTELSRVLESHLHVEATRAVIHDEDAGRWSALFDGDSMPTAATLRALMVADRDHALVPRLAQGLVASRHQGRWGNTYTTLKSFQALSDYVRDYEAQPAHGVVVKQAGVEILEGTLDKVLTVDVPMDRLEAGPLEFEPIEGRFYYEARLAYGLDEMPPRDAGFTVQRTLTVLEGEGGAGAVTSGALVEIELRITTPIDRTYVAVNDPIPAGMEPVNTFFATTAGSLADGEMEDSGWGYGYGYYYDTGWSDEPPTWSDWVFNHREIHDDRVTLYSNWMPAGIHVVNYVARATTPGDYSHPAATAEEMYRPENFGRTEQGRFTVGAAPVAQD